MSRSHDLARLIHESHIKRCGRKPPLLPMHVRNAKRQRVSALDLSLRMRERKIVWAYDDVLAALVELEVAGVLFRGEGGFAVLSLAALSDAAGGLSRSGGGS